MIDLEGLVPTAQRGRRMVVPAIVSMAAVLGLSVGGIWIMMGEELPFWGGDAPPSAMPRSAVNFANVDQAIPEREGQESGRDDSIEANGRYARSASMDQKMQAGMRVASARRHSFQNEPVRLNVAARSAREGDSLRRELVAFLRARNTVDIDDVGDDDLPIPNRAFYLEGKRGLNFEGTGKRQLLVRVSRSNLAEMVDRLVSSSPGKLPISLAAGPVSIRGAAQVRSTLFGLDEADSNVTRSTSGPKAGWLEELIRFAGSEGNAKTESVDVEEAVSPGPVAPTVDSETRYADARSKYDDLDYSPLEQKKKPAAVEEVGASKEGIAGGRASARGAARPSVTAERTEAYLGREKGGRRSRSDGGERQKLRSGRMPREASVGTPELVPDTAEESQSATSGYVTLIIEITFDPPRSKRPTPANRGKSRTGSKSTDTDAR